MKNTFLQSLSALLNRLTSLKTLVLLLMLIIPLNVLAFPLAANQIQQLSGGMSMFDLQFTYSPQTALNTTAAYGPQGRSLYLITAWTADLIYPLLYTGLFTVLLNLILHQSVENASPWMRLRMMPLGMMTCDYLENTFVSLLLATYPLQSPVIASLAALFTTLKWAFAILVGLSVAASLVLLLRRYTLLNRPQGD